MACAFVASEAAASKSSSKAAIFASSDSICADSFSICLGALLRFLRSASLTLPFLPPLAPPLAALASALSAFALALSADFAAASLESINSKYCVMDPANVETKPSPGKTKSSSHVASIKARSWETKSKAPSCDSTKKRSRACRAPKSKSLEGSSKIKRFGLASSTAMSCSRRRSPPERLEMGACHAAESSNWYLFKSSTAPAKRSVSLYVDSSRRERTFKAASKGDDSRVWGGFCE
mmetsp:Transcript_15012/g.50360  ORF Transcript_15012/g.50360 Transcript_15012/m.50360 type:complete len:236 (+) Transcript_15012:182-889(+)